MKLSEKIKNWASAPKLKAKLNKSIKLNNGKTFKKGTVSEFLIKTDNELYHFEADNNACTVSESEITFITKL